MKCAGYHESMTEATNARPPRRGSVGVSQATSHPGRASGPSRSVVGRYTNRAVTGGSVADGVTIAR